MLNAIRRWWSPPHFDHDPEQAAQARVINALILNTGALLLVAAVIIVPFFVVQKISAWGLLGVLLGVLALGRALIFRGRFRLGVTVILTVSWLCFLALTLISTGAANPGMFYLASVILIAGFVLGRRAANALTLLAVLIALAVNGLGSQGLALPAVFIFTPLTGWVAFGLGLAFMNSARSLFVSHLEEALARARQENAARQAAEATLRESEAKFRAQYLGFPLPTYTWRQAGEDWVLVDYNASALAFTQGQVVNVLGQAAGVVYRADPETLHELSQCGRTRTNAQVERWHRLASTGERKYLALNYTFVPPDLVMVHTDDITERRRNEAAVRASEARFRAVVEHTSQGIVFMDAARRIVYASPAYIQLIGTAPQDLIGRSGVDYVLPADREATAGAFAELLQAPGRAVSLEYRLQRQDGSACWVETTAANLLADPDVQAIVLNSREITDRKRAEEALRESESNHRALIETLSEGVALNQVIYDEHGEMVDYRILEVNPAFYTTADYAGPVVGQLATVLYRMTPEYIRAFWLQHRNRRTLQFTEMESPIHQRIFWVATSPIVNDRFVTSFFDITERKRAEEELRESEERYKSLFQNNYAVMLIIDPESTAIVDANPAACAYYGWTRAELLTKKVGEINTLTDAELRAEMQLARTQQRSHFFFTHRRADGAVREVEVYSGPLALAGQTRLYSIVHDVTERRQAERALRDSEAQYRQLFNQMLSGLLVCDVICDEAGRPYDHRFVQGNPAFEKLTGLSAAEQIGKNSREFAVGWPPEVVQQLYSVALTGEPIQYERFNETLGRFYETRVFAPRLGQFAHVFTDITDRKRAEAALRESEAKFRAVVDNSNDGIIFADADARILYRSPSYNRINGYTDAERVGHSGFETVHPEDLADVRAYWAALVEHPAGAQRIEYRIRHKDGTWRWIETSGQNMLPNPEVRAVVVNSRDITERKRAEGALRESEARLRAVVQTANDAIITMDAHGGVVSWNAAAEVIFGFAAEEMIGQPVSRIAPAAWQPRHWRGLERARAHPEQPVAGRTFQAAGVTKAGREFPLELSLAEWRTEAGEFFTAVIRDISERQQRENELQAIATLSAALRTAPTRAEMLPVLVEQLRRLLDCAAAAVELIDPLTQAAVLEAVGGVWDVRPGVRQPPEAGLNARLRQPFLDNHLNADCPADYPRPWLASLPAGAGVPLIAQDQQIGYVWMGGRRAITAAEMRLLTAVADIAANALHRAMLHERTQQDAADLARAYDTTLEGWARALELRDQETEGHTRRVVQMTLDLARALGLSEIEVERLRRGALLHDIGKMGIPDSVLLKPGTLNEREWEIMRRHPEYAAELLRPIEYLRPALDIPLYHHEKWDGSGYPRGLRGADIPLAARIFAVVDVWDALCSDRPYRPAWTKAAARTYLQQQAGRHFDPAVVEAFLQTSQSSTP